MTVEELIENLKTRNPKAQVLRGDNSGGFEEIHNCRVTTVRPINQPNENKEVIVLE